MKLSLVKYLLFISLFFGSNSFAQSHFKGEDLVGVAAKLAIPTGSFSDTYNIGWGISGMDEYVLSSNWSIGVDVSYLRWGVKNNLQSAIDHFSVISFSASPKYYLIDQLYLACDIGLFYKTTAFKKSAQTDFAESYHIGYAPTVGIRYGMFDLALEYAFVEKIQWINVRAGFYLFDFRP